MEGKGIVAISLPVRLFEKRSTVERICDLWCTGPIYLKKAGTELAQYFAQWSQWELSRLRQRPLRPQDDRLDPLLKLV